MMNHLKAKKIIAATILALLMTSIGLLSCASAAISVKQENTLVFLRDVVGLDMTKYKLTAVDEDAYAGHFLYNLTYGDTAIEVLCGFRDNDLAWCHLYPSSGSQVLLTQPATNALDAARNAVDRYQTYLKAQHTSQMRETIGMISAVNVDSAADDYRTLKPAASASTGNMTLTVWSGTDDNGIVQFEWMNTVSGIQNIYNRVVFTFSRNGLLQGFADEWTRYPVGSADVKLSKEQAISLAQERLTSFSYSMGNVTVENLAVAKDFPVAAEVSMQPRNGMLYPHWEIYLPLDHVYPGNIVTIRVMMWADTGEVDSIHASSTLGNIVDEGFILAPIPTNSQSPTLIVPSQQPTPSLGLSTSSPDATKTSENTAPASFDISLALYTILATVAIALTALYLKKRSR